MSLHPTPEAVHQIQHRVEFHETDLGGVVHFSNFLRYAEACEHDFLAKIGYDWREALAHSDAAWPRTHVTCDYLAPARFRDTLTVRLFLERVGVSSISYHFEIDHDDTALASGRVRVVFATREAGSFQKAPLPRKLVDALKGLPTSGEPIS
jgi:YbgC/YbaW family acyl-CoA thioester hydrolase